MKKGFILLFCLWHLVAGVENEGSLQSLEVPNLTLQDQDGKSVHFYDDLIKGRLVAINFIFTSCPTVCPPMGANFAALQKELSRSDRQVSLVSVSIDPQTDTPARLKAWRDKFGGGPGWELVTGKKQDVEKLLKMLHVFSADINLHAPFVVIGNDRTGKWQYVNGLTEPTRLMGLLDNFSSSGDNDQLREPTETESSAARYFTDVVLLDQFGQQHRLYSDLLKDKVVIINSFFASCKGVCIKTMGSFDEIQERLGSRLGKEVYMLSFSVDPLQDTPDRLAEYARAMEVKPGWFLLTGSRENMDKALTKIGQYVDNPENHSNIFIVGNEKTGLWKKAFGLAGTDAVLEVIESVIANRD